MALYFVADPVMVTLGLIGEADHADLVRAEYEGYARNALSQLRRIREGHHIEEDHMRNRQAIVYWLMAHTSAIETRVRDGKTYYVVVDVDAFREGAGRLLAEIQRIKSEGDYDAAKAFFEQYGTYLRSGAARRGREACRRARVALVQRVRDADPHAGVWRRRPDHRRGHVVPV